MKPPQKSPPAQAEHGGKRSRDAMASTKPPKIVKPNLAVLRWAVEQFRDPSDISVRPEWLNGSSWPTYRQLETVAEQSRLPFATFFLPGPPDEPLIPVSFRTRLEKTGSVEKQAVREVTRLFSLQARLRDEGLIFEEPRFRELQKHAHREDPERLARRTLKALDWTQPLNSSSYASGYDALKEMRQAIEERLGILVLQLTLEDQELAGFALVESGPPTIIALRAGDKPEVRRFTLGHELYHALRAESDVAVGSDLLTSGSEEEERRANQFAAELLLPNTEPVRDYLNTYFDGTRSGVSKMARNLSLSYSFVLYRSKAILNLDSEKIRPLILSPTKPEKEREAKKTSRGADYYVRKASELGHVLPRRIWERLDTGKMHPSAACDLLDVRIDNLEKLRDTTY